MRLLFLVVLIAAVGAWSKAPKLPHPRSAHAVVVEHGSIYVLGGPSTAVVDRFDGKKWHRETILPGGKVNAPAAVSLARKLYVIGGFSGSSNRPESTVRVHDPATGSWSEAAPLPRAEGSPAAVVFHGRLYAIGGCSGTSDYGDVFVYDATSDTWSNGPSIPPRGTAGATVFHDAIYVFGGESQARFKTLRDVYRLTAGSTVWAKVALLPKARNYARAVVFRNTVYVVGGSRTPGDSHGSYGSRLVDRFTG